MALPSFNTLIACLPCPCQTDCFIKGLCLVRVPHLVVGPSLETTEDRKNWCSVKNVQNFYISMSNSITVWAKVRYLVWLKSWFLLRWYITMIWLMQTANADFQVVLKVNKLITQLWFNKNWSPSVSLTLSITICVLCYQCGFIDGNVSRLVSPLLWH